MPRKIASRSALSSSELKKDEEQAIMTPQQIRKQKAAIVSPATPHSSRKLVFDITDEKKDDGVPTNIVTPVKDRVTVTTNNCQKPASSSSRVKEAYKIIRKSCGALGGNGYSGAIYGELREKSMQCVLDYLVATCELSRQSRFLDVGSGLGKPNFHAAQSPGCRLSLGVELEEIRWKLAMHNLKSISPHLYDWLEETSDTKLNPGVNFIVNDIDNAVTTDPFTHVYMFDLGFPPPLQQSIARKFNDSCYGKYLISYRPPHRVIEEYGYKVDFMGQLLTTMHGSGEGHTAYFYKRSNSPTAESKKKSCPKVLIPGRKKTMSDNTNREDGEEEDISVVCDKIFVQAVELAVGPLEALRMYVDEVVTEHLSSGRPQRSRKAKTLTDYYQLA